MFITMSAAARVNAVFSRGLSSPDRRQAAPLWSRDSRSVTWYIGLAGAMTRKWESPPRPPCMIRISRQPTRSVAKRMQAIMLGGAVPSISLSGRGPSLGFSGIGQPVSPTS